MHQLTEKQVYQLQLQITERLYGPFARITPTMVETVRRAVEETLVWLKAQGIAQYAPQAPSK